MVTGGELSEVLSGVETWGTGPSGAFRSLHDNVSLEKESNPFDFKTQTAGSTDAGLPVKNPDISAVRDTVSAKRKRASDLLQVKSDTLQGQKTPFESIIVENVASPIIE